jgi:flagellar FliL protein
MATKAASADIPVEAKPKKSRLVAIIIALVIVLAGAGGAAWYFLGSKAAAEAEKAQATNVASPPVFLPMEAFTVNLQSENGEQFLQTSFTLQVKSQEAVDLIKLYMPHVRSRILLLLSSKKASDILSTEGKDKLAQEIIAAIKKPFTPNGASVDVTSVLFTSFVVQ